MSSRRTECTRRDRPASFGPPCSGGTPCPIILSVSTILLELNVMSSQVRSGQIGMVAYIFSRGVALQVGLNGLVLLVKVRQVRYQVLDDVGVRQGVDLDIGRGLGGDSAQASQGVLAVDVHGTAAADALSATPSEGQGRVLLVLDLDQGIQDHGARLVEVNGVGLKLGLLGRGIGIPSVDLERLDLGLLLSSLADRCHGPREDGTGTESCPSRGAEDSHRGADSGHDCCCLVFRVSMLFRRFGSVRDSFPRKMEVRITCRTT